MLPMKTIGQIISNNVTLDDLIAQAKRLQYLNKVLSSVLEASLSQHCHLSKVDGNTMTIAVDSPTWATRLRYDIPEILKNARTQPEFKEVTAIKYVVERR